MNELKSSAWTRQDTEYFNKRLISDFDKQANTYADANIII